MTERETRTKQQRKRRDRVSCAKKLEMPAKGEPTCTDMPRRAKAQAKSMLMTQRNCPKWRGPSDKPWSHWCNTPLDFRIGSYVELIDAVALQTNTRYRSTKTGRDQIRQGPGEPLRSSLTKHHPLNESIRKYEAVLASERAGILRCLGKNEHKQMTETQGAGQSGQETRARGATDTHVPKRATKLL